MSGNGRAEAGLGGGSFFPGKNGPHKRRPWTPCGAAAMNGVAAHPAGRPARSRNRGRRFGPAAADARLPDLLGAGRAGSRESGKPGEREAVRADWHEPRAGGGADAPPGVPVCGPEDAPPQNGEIPAALTVARRASARPARRRPLRLTSDGDVAVLLQDRLRLLQPALDPRVHPAVGVVFLVDPLLAPERDGDLPVRPALGLALKRQQKLSIPVPRTRPDRGAGTLDQTSSIRATSRTSKSPPSAGNASLPGIRTWAAAPFRSILRISEPSPSRSPESAASPPAANTASGGASDVTMPSDIAARAQKGATGPRSE